MTPLELVAQLYDPETKQPFVLLPAERRFLEHAFLRTADGRLLYPEQVFACPKKSGKTTFAALHALITTLLFGGAYPEATILANDYEQAVGRVFEMCRRIVECSPLLRRDARISSDRIVFPGLNATIAAIPFDYASAAGGNHCIAVFDELWAYTSERSHRLWDEMIPVPTRKTACRLTVTYAGFEGESALLEGLYRRGLQQPLVTDCPDLRAGDGILMFWSHRPIAPWQSEAWLADMRRSLRPAQYLRMIENRFVSTESSFIDLAWWDACVDPAATPLLVRRSLPVSVGIDASVKRDATAIVACSYDRQRQKVVLVWHRIFQPTPDDPIDFEAAVEDTVLDLRSRFRVQRVLYDPYQMAASAQRLARASVKMEEYPQSVPNLTASSQNLYELIKGRNLIAYPDAQLRLAISRAVAIESARGWRIAKDKQTHRIDVVVALAMAALAAIQTQSSYDSSLNWVSGPDRDTAAPAVSADTGTAASSVAVFDSAWQRSQRNAYIASGGWRRPY
jgi:hypothetical protein